jgi:hypothetical protein
MSAAVGNEQDGGSMAESTPWDALYEEYLNALPRLRIDPLPLVRSDPQTVSHARILGNPSPEDVRWLTRALALPQHKWFVVGLLEAAPSLSESLFGPVMDAGIAELNPSLNRYFIEPCIRAFGLRRVNEYLLDMLEAGTDSQKAGAVNALYWAQAAVGSAGNTSDYGDGRAPVAFGRASEELGDIWTRARTLCLKTFVSNPDADVRRSLIARLILDEAAYDPADQPLVSQAIRIARAQWDPYIRHRLAVQLGELQLLPALPHQDE